LTVAAPPGTYEIVSASASEADGGRRRKHRHDEGAVDHGAETQTGPTVAIQVVLGAAILLTAALLLYAVLLAGKGPRTHAARPAAGAGVAVVGGAR
jgi:hypothetical protein